MTLEEARREARMRLGGLRSSARTHRERRGLPVLETLCRTCATPFRTLRRDAGFTTFAVLIVGLGIGASATVFSVVNAAAAPPPPVPRPGQLVWIANTARCRGCRAQTVPVGPLHWICATQNQSFSDIAAYYAFYGVGDSKLTGTVSRSG